MAKIESTLRNMILSLALISMTMSASLAFVYLKTKGPIAASALQKEMNAIEVVLPEFDSDPLSDMKTVDDVVIYTVAMNGQPAGYAIKTYSDNGFGGRIEIMAGFMPDGSINGISVLQQKETPGLGTKMSEPGFYTQFLGKNPSQYKLRVKKDGGDVDAITAATISSRAYCDALQRAFDALVKINDSLTVTLSELIK